MFSLHPKSIENGWAFLKYCKYIGESLLVYSSIKVLVFTDGECTLLGDDLFKSIRYATNKGLLKRIVTNQLSETELRNLISLNMDSHE